MLFVSGDLHKLERMTDATGAAQAHGDSIAGVVDERAGRLHDVDHCAGDIGAGDEAENASDQLNRASRSVQR